MLLGGLPHNLCVHEGVCGAPCKSHYVISAGQVEWLPAFSEAHAKAVMHDQIARHASRDAQHLSWVDEAAKASILDTGVG